MSNLTMNPFLAVDGYKIFHQLMEIEGCTKIYSNFTPRSDKWAPKGCEKVLVFGPQMTFIEIHDMFETGFFSQPASIIDDIKKEYDLFSGRDYDISKIKALYKLGYLPIHVKALEEGTECPFGVPILTVTNTNPEFSWITNFIETMISNMLWKPMTSATIALMFKRLNDKWINKTDPGNDFHSQFGCHDFSMRGMDSMFATMSSGLGHNICHSGSDSMPIIHAARKYYLATGFVAGSIPATEHSIQCSYWDEETGDLDYVKTMITRFPTGPLGLVLDGMDLFKAITEVLPILKLQIMAREGGPLVVRPDSGDPADIICGAENYVGPVEHIDRPAPQEKGVVELLWDIFGGTTNDAGYKVLHPCIRVIYGDAISLERFDEINTRLEAKGFASTNWVAGVGSFTYQFNTRDTLGFAMKATYIETKQCNNEYCIQDRCFGECVDGKPNIVGKNIFKDPATGDGTKTSATGLLSVRQDLHGTLVLLDEVSPEKEQKGMLKTIYKDSLFTNLIALNTIKDRVRKLSSV